jgi:broad specificity phosphatase PhoE
MPMKHATKDGLVPFVHLLDKIRLEPRLKEWSFGIFYLDGKAFLQFHEDPRGLFADLRGPDDWERFPVGARQQQTQLLARISALLTAQVNGKRR